jgi:hypothetical protein
VRLSPLYLSLCVWFFNRYLLGRVFFGLSFSRTPLARVLTPQRLLGASVPPPVGKINVFQHHAVACHNQFLILVVPARVPPSLGDGWGLAHLLVGQGSGSQYPGAITGQMTHALSILRVGRSHRNRSYDLGAIIISTPLRDTHWRGQYTVSPVALPVP